MPPPASASGPSSSRAVEPTLLLVYHADSGRWNALWDIAHKVISPDSYPCALCALTHGAMSERGVWKSFRERHPGRLDVLHRDEQRQRHPDMIVATPCIVERLVDGRWRVVATPETIQAMPDVEALVAQLERILTATTP